MPVSIDKHYPFPSIADDGYLSDGTAYCIPRTCLRCSNRACSEAPMEHGYKKCKDGLYFTRVTQIQNRPVFIGIDKDGKHPKQKRADAVPFAPIRHFLRHLPDIQQAWRMRINSEISRAMVSLHDVRTVLGTVMRSAESIIQNSQGVGFHEKLNNCAPPIRDIFYSSELLVDLLKILDVYSNPESAGYGRPNAISVYQLADKLRRMFYSKANAKKIRVNLTGGSRKTVCVFDSFALMILILIDNAIKYSTKNQDIDIIVSDCARGVSFSITSFGPQISPAEVDLIFTEGFRGKTGILFASEGAGIGLSVAASIADCHNTKITVLAHSSGTEVDNIALGENTFSFDVFDVT